MRVVPVLGVVAPYSFFFFCRSGRAGCYGVHRLPVQGEIYRAHFQALRIYFLFCHFCDKKKRKRGCIFGACLTATLKPHTMYYTATFKLTGCPYAFDAYDIPEDVATSSESELLQYLADTHGNGSVDDSGNTLLAVSAVWGIKPQ